MQSELLKLIQDRMATSYTEQLWVVTLIGSMSGFVITQADRLIAAVGYRKIRFAISIVTLLCVAFILLRHGIYLHYSSMIDQEYPQLTDLSPVMIFFRWVTLCSGALLYICITVGMSVAVVLSCKNAEKSANTSKK